MNKPTFELAEIIQKHNTTFTEKHHPPKQHIGVLNAIAFCRTAYFGGHVDTCNSCNHERISYNSCRNRHCPKCQGTNRERWILARQNDLLPVPYFHVVFTIPHELNAYCMQYPKALYNMLFSASKETIMQFGRNPKNLGAQMGIISVLHTWGQNLSLHPHVHMIIPGGGITGTGEWQPAKSKGRYLFPVEALSIVYRGKFMEQLKIFLEEKNGSLPVNLRRSLYAKKWVVYAKRPFGGPKQVIEYLGRYSHKIAISNHRIKNIKDGMITFSYKDYAQKSAQKEMTLDADEFLRRFCLHILPAKFMKIRHYGILASRVKPKLKIQQIKMGINVPKKEKITWQEITLNKLGFDIAACPCCKTGRMIRTMSFDAHAPPPIINNKLLKTNEMKWSRLQN